MCLQELLCFSGVALSGSIFQTVHKVLLLFLGLQSYLRVVVSLESLAAALGCVLALANCLVLSALTLAGFGAIANQKGSLHSQRINLMDDPIAACIMHQCQSHKGTTICIRDR